MRNFWAVFKRELKVYFTSPIAYTIIAIFLVIGGYFFYSGLSFYILSSYQAMQNPGMSGLNVADAIIKPLFGNLSVILLLMLPAVTMRLFSEEKKSGTFELLFTFPIRDIEVVLGKFFAALGVFAVMLGSTVIYILMLQSYGFSHIGVVLSSYLGVFLMGASFISLGVFISAMTENQVVAAVVSFGVLLVLWVVGWVERLVHPAVGKVLVYISLVKHYANFTRGVVDTSDLIFFFSFIFFFLFLTLRILESKRWRS